MDRLNKIGFAKLMMSAGLVFSLGCGNPFAGEKSESSMASVEFVLPGLEQFSGQGKAADSTSDFNFDAYSVDSDFALTAPVSIDEITCLAVAVEWGEADQDSMACDSSSGDTFNPGLFQGLYLPGAKVELKLPMGDNRKIYLVGFKADSSEVCRLLRGAEKLPKNRLSAPIILSQIEVSIEQGKQVIELVLDTANAQILGSCTGQVIEEPAPVTGTPVVEVPPTSPTVTYNDTLGFNDTLSFNDSAPPPPPPVVNPVPVLAADEKYMNSFGLGAANVTTKWTIPSAMTASSASGLVAHTIQTCFTQDQIGMPPTDHLSQSQCELGCQKVYAAMTTPRPVWCAWRGPDGSTKILSRGFESLIEALPKIAAPTLTGKDRVGYFMVNRTLGVAYKRAMIELSQASTVDVYVPYRTSSGTAIAGVHYIETQGVAVIPAGAKVGEILIETTLDQVSSANIGKTFYINLSQPVNGGAVLLTQKFSVSFQPVSAR
jgi:hypothetical protein